MARFRHISTKMVLVLDAGTENGKKITKRVTIDNIREDASTDALWELAQTLGKLLAYPVAEVRLYKVEAVEREEADGAAHENGGVDKDADKDDARTDNTRGNGNEAFPAFVPRGGRALAEYRRHAEHSKQTMYGKQAARHIAAVCRPDCRAALTATVGVGAAARMNSPPLSRVNDNIC